QVVVEHVSADPEACRCLRSADQRRQRRQEVGQVVGDSEHGIAEVFEFASLFRPGSPRWRTSNIDTKTEELHRSPLSFLCSMLICHVNLPNNLLSDKDVAISNIAGYYA